MKIGQLALFALALPVIGCQGPTYPVLYRTLEADRSAERIEELAAGTPVAAALNHLGFIPVHNPAWPSRPYFNPFYSETLFKAAGEQVDVFVYVVRVAVDESDCPVVSKAPLVFVAGKLVSKDWGFLEERLDALGKSPGWLRRMKEPRPFLHCGLR